MENMEKITVKELASRMRKMEIGTVIDLQGGTSGDGWFGIRRLPDDMFDNGKCWIADYYGGGFTKAFSEDPNDDYGCMTDELADWLAYNDLFDGDGEIVNVEIKDETEPQTKWEFKKTVIPPKNKMVSVTFILSHAYRTYISAPPQSTDDEIVELTKASLIDCDKEQFLGSVIDVDAEHWDVWPEDFVDVVVNHDEKRPTLLPTGTLRPTFLPAGNANK